MPLMSSGINDRMPKSLYAPAGFLSHEECRALFDKIVSLTNGGGETRVSITSRLNGAAKWARNRISMASNAHTIDIQIGRTIRGAGSTSTTTRTDEAGLLCAIRNAEETLRVGGESPENIDDPFINEPTLSPILWSDATYGFSPEKRTDLVQELIAPADAAGMMSAGTLKMMAEGTATLATDGLFRYYPTTGIECSMTVRDTKGTASGWAGVNHYDAAKVDAKGLAAIALDKCLSMQKPSAVEPGRYTVILEPQAVADLFQPIVDRAMARVPAENMIGPFAQSPGRSKIGQQVLDRRMIMRSDPMDSDGGFIPFEQWSGTPYQPVNWIDQGMLRELAYNKRYALAALGLDKALPNPRSYRLAAAPGVSTATVAEMIANTERGILVTRFHGVHLVDLHSMLCSGYTRDGLWLIEHGKISRPVKNFRFTESPLFALNQIEEIGVPKRVFAPGQAFVVPPVRVRDFSFTSLADAV